MTLRLRPELALAFVLSIGTACTTDGGTDSDSGNNNTPPDAGGEPDSGEVDSGEAPDTGEVDAGVATTIAPPRRGDMAYAADTTNGKVYFFHGDRAEPQMCNIPASDFMTDGWVFDTNTRQWTELVADAASPMPTIRARASGAWDPMRNRFIMFGGRHRVGTMGNYTFFKDLWAFDPATNMWEELFAQNMGGGPTGRMNSAMVADPANDRVIVHGGGTTDFATFQVNNDTWAFSLANYSWERIGNTGTLPEQRIFHVTAFDSTRRRMYVFGGGGEDAFTGVFFDHLWYLDLDADTWTRVPRVNPWPGGRIKGNLEYSPDVDKIILFAGHDNTQLGNNNELWSLDPESNAWTFEKEGDRFNRDATAFCDFPSDFATIDPESPERRESALFTVLGGRAFMHAGRTDCGLSNDTWYLDLTNWVWEQITISFTGMTCYRSGRTDCDEPNAKKCG